MDKTEPGVIVDSRIAWHWIPNSLKVFLYVDIGEAAARVFNAKRSSEQYTNIEDASSKLSMRKEMEIKRLKSLYAIDFSDLKNYDLVIDTTQISPEKVCNRILERMNI
ncbi:MAG: hypothetical protein IPH20_14335 [Bacteroidales bacterium]|nr:hypothetical protein [Bacteroidales bacterium]